MRQKDNTPEILRFQRLDVNDIHGVSGGGSLTGDVPMSRGLRWGPSVMAGMKAGEIADTNPI